jgi:putative RecB family exonuclease
MFIKKKIEGLLMQTNMHYLIEDIFLDFAIVDQSELLDSKEEIILFKEKLLLFVKEQEENSLLMVDDIIEFVKKHETITKEKEAKKEIHDKKSVSNKIFLDLDYLILRAKLRGDTKEKEKLEKKKEKVIAKSEDLDVAYYVEQIKKDKYMDEKQLEKLPTFSASQFGMYDTCPNQYRFSYLYSIPVPQKYYFVFGNVMHSVIEEITKRIKDGREVNESFATLMYESLWESNGYESKKQEDEYKKTGHKIIEQFLKKQKEVDTQIVEIEKKFNLDIEKFKVVGYIDRIDLDKSGDYVVIDYKTSKSEKDKQALRKDIQLLLYYDAIHKLYGKTPKLVGHWYLLSDNVVSIQPTVSDLMEIRSKILTICTSILTEQFEPKKSSSCEYCDFKLLCKLW